MKSKRNYQLFTVLLSGTLILSNISPAFAQDVKRESSQTSTDPIIEQKSIEEPQQKLEIDENFEFKKDESEKDESQQNPKEIQETQKKEEKKESSEEKAESVPQSTPSTISTTPTNTSEVISTEPEKKDIIKKPNVNYSSYIQNKGWQKGVTNGFISGTIENIYPIEAININLSDRNEEILYRTYCQSNGWTNWVNGGGSTKQIAENSLPIEAMQINLTGKLKENFDVYYRTYDKEIGWLDWVKNGDTAGLPNQNSKIEAYQIKLIEKDKELEDEKPQIKNCSADLKDIDIINAHVAIDHSENVSNVKFVAWSTEIGINDSKWYQGYYANGQWSALINIDEHQIKSGKYQIRCYIDCVNENTIEEECEIIVPDRKMTVTQLNGNKKTYRINITNVPSTTKEVSISTRNTKNDVVWYKANKITDHEYQINVETENDEEIMEVQAYGKIEDKSYFLANYNSKIQ